MKPDSNTTSSEGAVGPSQSGHGFAGLDVYREHSFRIAELGVEATDREFKRRLELVDAAEKARLPVPSGPGRAFPLSPPADAHQLREVIERLSSDPERRVMEELFWFWPLTSGASKTDEALSALSHGDVGTAQRWWREKEQQPEFRAAAEHNLAVLAHLGALELERDGAETSVCQQREAYWREAMERWRRAWESEAVWSRVTERIRQLDPQQQRLKTGLSHRLQEWLPRGLLRINGQLAVRYGEGEQRTEV